MVFRPTVYPRLPRAPWIRGSLDPGIAPARIVARHLEDQGLDLAGDSRPTRAASRASVVLLRDELAVPAKQGIRSHDRGELAEPTPSEWLRLSREAATLRVREAKSLSAELLEESLVLGLQVLDGLFLLAADPSDQQEQEKLNRERHRAWTLARLQRAEIGGSRRDQPTIKPSIPETFCVG
jgi:hypothetical protein